MAVPPSVPPLLEPPNPGKWAPSHKTPPVASLWQETCATTTSTPWTPQCHPQTTTAIPKPSLPASPALLGPSLGHWCCSWSLSTARHEQNKSKFPSS